jgi:hypothetical protein
MLNNETLCLRLERSGVFIEGAGRAVPVEIHAGRNLCEQWFAAPSQLAAQEALAAYVRHYEQCIAPAASYAPMDETEVL